MLRDGRNVGSIQSAAFSRHCLAYLDAALCPCSEECRQNPPLKPDTQKILPEELRVGFRRVSFMPLKIRRHRIQIFGCAG